MESRPYAWIAPHDPMWLVLTCLTAAVGLAWVGRWHARQAAAAAREQERRRIARELHDTLLQSMQALIFELHALAAHPTADDGLRAALLEALESAEASLVEGRDRVMALRESRASSALASSVAAGARAMCATGQVQLRAVVAGASRSLRPAALDAAVQIGLEAVRNALRHAGANTVEIRLDFGADALRLSVGDDGIGLAQQALDRAACNGHTGWLGMRERAQAIGARLSWQARGKEGTDVELSIPACVAYGTTAGPRAARSHEESARC